MTELLAGLSLGLGAGLTPGPLMTLVVTSALERGFGAGARVAVAPLLTDAPIVILTVALVSSVSSGVLRAIGVGGGVVVVAVGLWMIVSNSAEPKGDDPGSGDVWRGVLVNVASPHPWIFWVGVGAPLLVAAWRNSVAFGLAFLAGFYSLLVGSKIAMAWIVGRAGRRITSVWRSRLVIGGGVLLVAGGGLLIWEAASGRL